MMTPHKEIQFSVKNTIYLTSIANAIKC